MELARLGRDGPVVSRLALGGSTFTRGDNSLGAFYKAEPQVADRLIGMALDAGVTLFDTADVYASGQSEEIIGAALAPHRDRVVIGTKVGNRGPGKPGLSRAHIGRAIDASLARLGTDRVDIWTVHCVDPLTPLEETLAALDAVVRAGKVRWLGVSNWPAWLVTRAVSLQEAHGLARFCHAQMYYSLLGRDVERDTLAMLGALGLGLSAWSPLAYGFLAGKYSREDMARDDNRFARTDWLGFDRDRAFALLPLLEDMAAGKRCTMAQLAIAWLLHRPAVDAVILGATRAGQLAETLGAGAVALSADEIAALDAATAIVPAYPSSDWVAASR